MFTPENIGGNAMKKKFVSAVLAIVVLFGSAVSLPQGAFVDNTAMPASALTVNTDTSGKCGENVSWTLKNGVLTISGSGDMYDKYTYYTPDSYSPFCDREDITSVVIKDGVTSIGKHMFTYCNKITSVSIPSSVTKIGEYAFYRCEGLKKIVLPDSITTMEMNTFRCCTGLESVTLSKNLKVLDSCLFEECSSLKSVTIPKNVSTIVWSAFENCANLENIIVDADNKDFCDISGVLYTKDKKKIVICPPAKTSVTLPSSLNEIGYYSFGYCSKLKEIKIPESVTILNDLCFCHCTGLTTLTIPKNVEKYDESITFRCDNLTDINVDKNNAKFSSYDGVVYNKNQTILLGCPEGKATVNIPSTVTRIEEWALNTNRKITSIKLPSGLKSIGLHAFRDCSSLKSITIPDGVTAIGNCAFYGCSSLEYIKLPNGLTKLERSMFHSCEKLQEIKLPPNITLIKETAFYRCTNLRNVVIPDSVTTIQKSAFTYCNNLTSIILPKSLTNLEGSAFGSCPNLTNVYLQDGLKTIDDYAFGSKNNIKSIFIPSSVETIAQYAIGYNWASPNPTKVDGFTIYCEKGSAAEKYAKANGFTYINADITRLAGKNRYVTAAATSLNSYPDGCDTVVLAYGLNYADALAGVPLANKLKAPILLTSTKTLDDNTLAEIKRLGAKNIKILGGDGVISQNIIDTLVANGISNSKIERISGQTRYSTATAIADKLNENPEEVFFVCGNGFADALSVSTVAAIKKAPIIYLTKDGEINADTKAYLDKLKTKGCVKKAYVIGGTGVISDDMTKQAATALGVKSLTRLAGSDRYGTCLKVNSAFKSILSGTSLSVATGADFPDALAGGVLAAKNKSPMFLVNSKSAKLNLTDAQKAYLKEKAPKQYYIFGGNAAVPESHLSGIVSASG